MKGQWIGLYTGDVEGKLMVNIDESDEFFDVVAYIIPFDIKIPASIAYLSVEKEHSGKETTAYIYPVDPITETQCKWDDIKHLYGEDISHSSRAEVTIIVIDGKLQINAITDIGVALTSILVRPEETDESRISGRKMLWKNFKEYISEIPKSKYLFRGQKKTWPLRTSFHRRGRYRIDKLVDKDVVQLHKRLSAITNHYFDLARPEQYGSFLNLLQHHGYPTPLLDWSYSPYVAAFFAFRDWPIKYSDDELVRIYFFNNKEWQDKYRQSLNINPPYPHLSVLEFIAIDNPRLVPQQAVTTLTNIVDIEAYVLDKGAKFLQAIDIPASEREEAMTELRFMGITAGSMFPSIDGVCEEIRERNFQK